MKYCKILVFLISLTGIALIAGCENYAERTHPSWVAPTAGAVYDDSTIYARITQAVQTDPDLRGANIEVKVNDGHVTLTGKVLNENQITKINMHTWMVDGVKKVDNQVAK
ncbi:MAG: BON domain-containing protein [Nitrosomonas sp.]|nr:MAG: BON domain-containing protein [Nitrosomonas sp.]